MIGTQTFCVCVSSAGATTELAVETASDESLLGAPFDNTGKGCEALTSTELPHKGCEFLKCGNWGDDSKGKMCVTHEMLSPMPRTHVQEKKKSARSCDPSTGEVKTGRHLGLTGQPA